MEPLVLDQTSIWLGDGRQVDGHVVLADGYISDVEPGSYRGPLRALSLEGLSLSPGMIDLMALGGFNRSILRDDPMEIARAYLRLGVTGCQFCVASLSWDAMRGIAANVGRAMASDQSDTACVLGLYLEGPFQQPELTGASMRQFAIPPSPENVRRLLDDFGAVLTMVNVAPGLPGDVEAVRTLRQAGKTVSMAHSNAPAERVLACLDAGTSVLGHCWDNNSGLVGDSGVQQPTLEHVAMTDERVRFIHLICDGTHVHPVLVRLVARCRGAGAICLVTDAVIRAGCPDGPYTNDDGRSFMKKDGVGRTDTGWLCGSALLLPDQFRRFVQFTGSAPHEAIRTVTFNPAASLGLERTHGLIAPGRVADLVAWDDRLRVCKVWRGGREIKDVSRHAEVSL